MPFNLYKTKLILNGFKTKIKSTKKYAVNLRKLYTSTIK